MIPWEIRLLEKIEFSSPDECWEWVGSLTAKGYGQLYPERGAGLGYQASHRLAYIFFRGCIGDMHVLHSCDNRKCCNPKHLFLGTNEDNMRDKCAKGRAFTKSKILESDVKVIREMVTQGIKQKDVAQKFGVSKQTISVVINRKTKRYLREDV